MGRHAREEACPKGACRRPEAVSERPLGLSPKRGPRDYA